jgi:hypothetical protein
VEYVRQDYKPHKAGPEGDCSVCTGWDSAVTKMPQSVDLIGCEIGNICGQVFTLEDILPFLRSEIAGHWSLTPNMMIIFQRSLKHYFKDLDIKGLRMEPVFAVQFQHQSEVLRKYCHKHHEKLILDEQTVYAQTLTTDKHYIGMIGWGQNLFLLDGIHDDWLEKGDDKKQRGEKQHNIALKAHLRAILSEQLQGSGSQIEITRLSVAQQHLNENQTHHLSVCGILVFLWIYRFLLYVRQQKASGKKARRQTQRKQEIVTLFENKVTISRKIRDVYVDIGARIGTAKRTTDHTKQSNIMLSGLDWTCKDKAKIRRMQKKTLLLTRTDIK